MSSQNSTAKVNMQLIKLSFCPNSTQMLQLPEAGHKEAQDTEMLVHPITVFII